MTSAPITDDYYEVLEVSQAATKQAIKDSYRRLTKQLHPDKNPGNPNATAAFQLLTQAHGTLSDDTKRRHYDSVYPSIRPQWKQDTTSHESPGCHHSTSPPSSKSFSETEERLRTQIHYLRTKDECLEERFYMLRAKHSHTLNNITKVESALNDFTKVEETLKRMYAAAGIDSTSLWDARDHPLIVLEVRQRITEFYLRRVGLERERAELVDRRTKHVTEYNSINQKVIENKAQRDQLEILMQEARTNEEAAQQAEARAAAQRTRKQHTEREKRQQERDQEEKRKKQEEEESRRRRVVLEEIEKAKKADQARKAKDNQERARLLEETHRRQEAQRKEMERKEAERARAQYEAKAQAAEQRETTARAAEQRAREQQEQEERKKREDEESQCRREEIDKVRTADKAKIQKVEEANAQMAEEVKTLRDDLERTQAALNKMELHMNAQEMGRKQAEAVRTGRAATDTPDASADATGASSAKPAEFKTQNMGTGKRPTIVPGSSQPKTTLGSRRQDAGRARKAAHQEAAMKGNDSGQQQQQSTNPSRSHARWWTKIKGRH